MFKVLLVEDNSDAYQLVQRALGNSVQLEWVRSQREAAQILNRKTFDLCLLDVMLPDGDGFQLCSILQTHERWNNMPVIMLTARNSTPDKVLGFSVGADDFIPKPFDPLELKARVDAKLRRKEKNQQAADTVLAGDIEINKATQRAFLSTNGQTEELDLTPIEFKILLFLATNPNVVHTRDHILNKVWGESIHVYCRSVDTHVSKLRKKLGAQADMITSVHGQGYRFVADITGAKPGIEIPQPKPGELYMSRHA